MYAESPVYPPEVGHVTCETDMDSFLSDLMLVADTTAKMATKNLMAERNLVICRIQDVVSVLIFLLNCNFQN